MKYLTNSSFVLFIFSILFNLCFYGFYLVYTLYVLPYFQTSSYTMFYFAPDGKLPTTFELLTIGFKSISVWTQSFIIGVLLVYLTCYCRKFIQSKNGLSQVLYTTFIETILFTLLFAISEFIWYKIFLNDNVNFTLEILLSQIPLVMILYCVTLFPITVVLKNISEYKVNIFLLNLSVLLGKK